MITRWRALARLLVGLALTGSVWSACPERRAAPRRVPRSRPVADAPAPRAPLAAAPSAPTGSAGGGEGEAAGAFGSGLDRQGKPLRWLALGGGATPEMNPVSIEQDIALAAQALGGRGLILFAGGRGARDVQVLDPSPRGDPLLRQLAALFDPRGGRESSYRRSSLPIAAAASFEHARQAVTRLAGLEGEALTLYLAGHGEQGEHPRDNFLALWGGSELRVSDLADWLERARRSVRVVVTTCFGGGFAELAFAAARAERGAPAGLRCGFFATPADLPATGCDPNPDRAAQDGYALHFFNALRGRDRDGRALDLDALDLDADGRISLLEAHTRVNLASPSADVPTTTSERWLAAVAPRRGRRRSVVLPEQEAVVAVLSARTGLPPEARQAHAALHALERQVDAAREQRERAGAAEEQAAAAVIARLLGRWPVLDDAWHPDFGALLRQERAAIAAYLARSAEYRHYQQAGQALEAAQDAYWQLREQAAPVERLTRALDYRERAARLHAAKGGAWRAFERLRDCERGAP
ncbi:MAG: hypothetical protein IPL40_07095 [Proteobacteria bacterium]|nr:hypothetical protein [Pseudomonadota bacterium]